MTTIGDGAPIGDDGKKHKTIDGEIVPYDGAEREPPRAEEEDQRGPRRRWGEGTEIDEYEMREILMEWTARWPVADIARAHGVDPATIKAWCTEQMDRRRASSADIMKVRTELATEFEAIGHECWKLVRAYPGTTLSIQALAQLNTVTVNRARLLGAVAPTQIKADVDVTHQLAEDVALRNMIEQAQEKARADLAAVEAEFREVGQ